MPQPVLHIIATADGIVDVGLYCRGAESVRLYEALLPALDSIDDIIERVLNKDPMIDDLCPTRSGSEGTRLN